MIFSRWPVPLFIASPTITLQLLILETNFRWNSLPLSIFPNPTIATTFKSRVIFCHSCTKTAVLLLYRFVFANYHFILKITCVILKTNCISYNQQVIQHILNTAHHLWQNIEKFWKMKRFGQQINALKRKSSIKVHFGVFVFFWKISSITEKLKNE